MHAARSPILLALKRTQLQRQTARQFRHASTSARAASLPASSQSGHTRRVAGTFMMYVPVVAVVMFWPYAVTPLVDAFGGI